jgi:alpha(1,3/1,4) fucosyltransferase
MKHIRINFADFWPNFDRTDNYFYHLLSTKYSVEISDNPDILFFSVDYNHAHERDRFSRCKKIFFTGENVRPNFDDPESIICSRYSIGKCDAAISFDYNDDNRNYRFPLWAFYTDWFGVGYNSNRDPSYLVPVGNLIRRNINHKTSVRTQFCNFLFSNNSGKRISILDAIQGYRDVICAGNLRRNTNFSVAGRGDQVDKINFLSDFKFTIAAENSKYDGYVTEKILHPLSVCSIPIYWGSDRVIEDFNEKAIINANKLSLDEIVSEIIELDRNSDKFLEKINEPIFSNGIPEFVQPKNVLKFIEEVAI